MTAQNMTLNSSQYFRGFSPWRVVKGGCGVKSHWTVYFGGQQVACRSSKRDANAYYGFSA